ncbi:uncharacterized protein [Solanum lycopersicum]|uniref:uncharacterized protein isoform X11 n=1 Tax=Solanum lycopersicum TaxID=4081 RepID=UPI00374945B0
MAFHTACPFTCRKICFCPDGFPKGKNEFLSDVVKLEEFLKDPWGLKAKQPATIQKKAASASMMAKDFARQFESGDVEVRNRSSKKRLSKNRRSKKVHVLQKV